MKSIAILVVLLISLISISSAAGPRAVPDLYQGQCGVELSVPAPGLLANDAKSTSPLQVSTWTAPSLGTLVVNADGSFIYKPPQNIPSGTYVYFYYTATDGITVTSQALVKIGVSCACKGAAPDVNVCLGTPITSAFLISQGAGCIGCRDATPKFDLSKIPAQPVAGQCYSYTVSCPSCNLVTGRICFRGPCAITATPFTVCSGITPTSAQIMAQGSVTCSCDTLPVISNIHIVGDHWVYTITCQSECGPATKTGIVNIQIPCPPTSTPFIICSGLTPTAAMIKAEGSVSCGTGVCDATPVISGIHLAGNHWEYTITCTSALGCISTGTGIVNIETPCTPTSTSFTICPGVTPTAAMIEADGSVSCGTGVCDSTPVISNVRLAGDHWEYTITCTSALGCISTGTGIVNIETVCVPTSEPFTVCSGVTPTVAMIEADGSVSCGIGVCDSTPVISNVHLAGDHWEYTITCTTALGCSATATGIVNIETVCVPTSVAFTICEGVTPTADQILDSGVVSCGACDATPVISGIHIDGDHWVYTITCTTDLGCTATGAGIVNIGQPCVIDFTVFPIPVADCPSGALPTADEIISLGGVTCGCDATPVISNIHWVSQPPGEEWTGEYTITCTSADGCTSTTTGQFNNADCLTGCRCTPKAPNMCGCVGYPFPMALFNLKGGGCHPSLGCDITPTAVIDDSLVDYSTSGHTYPYTVTCAGCSEDTVTTTGYIYIRNQLCSLDGTNCYCPTHCP